jgi:selenocysteine-specific elongation factor
MDIIVGTAGHIDHGKTALVWALTGTDTDRLPEEKQRGITIELGFAELELGDARFGFVDVPGHERFVKNMLAGASGIDLVLLVVAADEGIMPQTREHFDICRLLEIGSGLVAITKSDMVDDEMLELVRDEVREFVAGTFLENAPVVGVSSRTGSGLDDLRSALASVAARIAAREDDRIARLWIDRSFAMKGFGTVVTGTLASGSISEADEMDLLPVGRRVRVRGLQSHGRKVATGHAGRRTAVNLAGVDHHDAGRGMLLAEAGVLSPSQVIDCHVEILPDAALPLRTRQRVRVHIGTAEVLARVAVIGRSTIDPGESGLAQFRLESPVAVILGERLILRSYSPQETIGGGAVLNPAGQRFRQRDAEALKSYLGDLHAHRHDRRALLHTMIEHTGQLGSTSAEIRALTGWTDQTLRAAAEKLIGDDKIRQFNSVYVSKGAFDRLSSDVLAAVERLHEQDRLSTSVSIERLRSSILKSLRPEIEDAVLSGLSKAGRLTVEGDAIRLAGRNMSLSAQEEKAVDALRDAIGKAGLEVPKIDDLLTSAAANAGVNSQTIRKLFQQLLDSGEVVRINADFAFSKPVISDLIENLRGHAGSSPDRSIDVPTFKNVAGVSRKYAIPLLEYFDQQRVTIRQGDKRIIL